VAEFHQRRLLVSLTTKKQKIFWQYYRIAKINRKFPENSNGKFQPGESCAMSAAEVRAKKEGHSNSWALYSCEGN
jgi:hypothetical protein